MQKTKISLEIDGRELTVAITIAMITNKILSIFVLGMKEIIFLVVA